MSTSISHHANPEFERFKNTAVARKWVQAGFYIPEAFGWKSKGFSISESMTLVQAGFSISDVVRIKSKAIWKNFTTDERLLWQATGFLYKEAVKFRKENISPKEALIKKHSEMPTGIAAYSGMPPSEARKWLNSGFPPEAAKKWRAAGFSLSETTLWNEMGVDVKKAERWTNKGFSISDACQWAAFNISPEDAKKWKNMGFSLQEAHQWGTHGFSWVEASAWRRKEYNPPEAKVLKQAGVSITDVQNCEKSAPRKGFADEMFTWETAGFLSAEAAQWKAAGIPLKKALNWKRHKFNAKEGAAWKKEGFSAEQARTWTKCKFSTQSAVEWIAQGFLMKWAMKWRSAGFSPQSAKMWRGNNFSIADATALNSVGFIDEKKGLSLGYATLLKNSRVLKEWVQVWGRQIPMACDWLSNNYFQDKPASAKRYFEAKVKIIDAEHDHKKQSIPVPNESGPENQGPVYPED